MNVIYDSTDKFRENLKNKTPDELREIIALQNPDFIEDIDRIENVFSTKLIHLKWPNGDPVTERKVTKDELILLVDEPFTHSPELNKRGVTLAEQKQLHMAKDPVLFARHFLGMEPRAYQALILRDPHEKKILRTGRRLGKALDEDELIPTPAGFTRMGDLKVGDQVLDENGKPCNVTFVTPTQLDRQCYEVKFSDGSTVIADEDHQFTVYSHHVRNNINRGMHSTNTPETLTVKQILETFDKNYGIPVTKPIQYEAKEYPLHPYLLGYWLGNKFSKEDKITTSDPEVIDYIKSLGFKVIRHPDNKYYWVKGLWQELNKLNVLDNKHIPHEYLIGSEDQRRELLAGLVDASAVVEGKSRIVFTNQIKALADDVHTLAASLGYIVRDSIEDIVKGESFFNVVGFTVSELVFRTKDLNDRLDFNKNANFLDFRYFSSITPVESRPVRCITVDSENSLYLATKNFIPTHNTYTLIVEMLHKCFMNKNYKVVVLAPRKVQVEQIFVDAIEHLEASPLLAKNFISKKTQNPHHQIKFANGSTIKLFTTGAKSASKADVVRGQEADMVVLDEMDYLHPDDFIAIMALLQQTDKYKEKKRLIGASTPTGRREIYYEWCINPPKGFTSFWFPSYVSPFWTTEMEEEQRSYYRSKFMGYSHEIEADFGENAEGVYPRRFVDPCFVEEPQWDYMPHMNYHDATYVIGVDWNKFSAGTMIVVLEIFPRKFGAEPNFQNKVRLCYREEITSEEYSLLSAVDRIIELNKLFLPKHIYVDQGYGETQYELLTKYGVDNPSSGLHKKVKAINSLVKSEIRDPRTGEMSRRPYKSMMVNNLRDMIEEERILFPAHDQDLYDELSAYIVERWSANGEPIFAAGGSASDHVHDALALAALSIAENFSQFAKKRQFKAPISIDINSFEVGINKSKEIDETSEDVVIVDQGKMIRKSDRGKRKSMSGHIIRNRKMSGGSNRANRNVKRKMF